MLINNVCNRIYIYKSGRQSTCCCMSIAKRKNKVITVQSYPNDSSSSCFIRRCCICRFQKRIICLSSCIIIIWIKYLISVYCSRLLSSCSIPSYNKFTVFPYNIVNHSIDNKVVSINCRNSSTVLIFEIYCTI